MVENEKAIEINELRGVNKRMVLDTRKDFEQLAWSLLSPVKPFYSDECARVILGSTSAHYPDKTAWMEGFARIFIGLAPLFAGGSHDEDFAEKCRKGLANGSNPESPEYWGECQDYDQILVEMAGLAYGLILAPEVFWSPLQEKEKENLVKWLWQINKKKCHNCNWQFFIVMINLALRKLGQPYSKEQMQIAIDFLETCYVSHGWYGDGDGEQMDYYVPFAFHFYGLIYAMNMKEEEPQISQRFIERAMVFGREFVYWFADSGAALPYGRSQTYRFAQAAFYSICVLAEIEPLPLPVMKGIIARNLKYWMNQPIFDSSGLLTIGYCYPNLQMAESYNSPVSPYWAMKAFAVLALPENHLFWRCKAAPLPQMEELHYLPGVDMLIQRRAGGDVVAFPGRKTREHVHTHTEEKYDKFAYSIKYGFSVRKSPYNLAESAPDSVLSFRVFDYIFIRGHEEYYETDANSVRSGWSPLAGIEVVSEIIPNHEGHIRKHKIISKYDCKAYDAGFALPMGEEEACQVVVVKGNGRNIQVAAHPNTNVINSKTSIPMAEYDIVAGKNEIETHFIYK